MPRCLLCHLILACVPALAVAQVPPEKAVSTMTVADGLQIELFASEPMLVNPTSIDVDHLGRVWVCEAVNYRRVMFNRPILRPEGDRIVILEDTKGIGKADKSTVFYQGKDLIAPIGICVAPIVSPQRKQGTNSGACKVFVCQSPDILVFEDLDGDGKADGPPKKFLTGFRGFDHDHGVHGINIGPDGKLYFTVGDAGVDGLKSSDGKGRVWKSNATDCRAGTVWRCDMDGKNLELIAHNFRNNYECCVNSFGEIWLSDNDDDGSQQTRICYVMPGGDYGYNPRGPGQSHWHEEQPGIVHKVLRTGFGSPTGICFYEGTLLPKKYQGQLLHCDAGPREFRCFHIKPKGAGYELEKELLVTSKDTWFRLSDVCVAPDGSVFLADWYDPGVGGHGMGDWTRGRIFRVTPKGHKGYKVPGVDVNTTEGFSAAFKSSNLATRYLAIAKLNEKVSSLVRLWKEKDEKLAPAGKIAWNQLKKYSEALRDSDQQQQVLARWYWSTSVDNSGRWNPTPLFRAMGAAEVSAAGTDRERPLLATALRIDRENGNEFFVDANNLLFFGKDEQKKLTPAQAISRKIDEFMEAYGPTAESRREMLITVRTLGPEFGTAVFYPLAKFYDGQDRFYLSALNIACGTDLTRRDATLADFDKHFPEWNDKVADLVWELRPKSMLPKMEALLADAKLTAAQKGRIVDILAVSDEPSAGKTMLALLKTDAPAEVKTRALDNLRLFLPGKWNALAKGDDLKPAIDQLLADPKTKDTGLQVIAAAKYTAAIDRVGALARQRNIEAIRTLGKLPDEKAVTELVEILGTAEIGRRSAKPDSTIEKELEAVETSAIIALGEQMGTRAESAAGSHALASLRAIVKSDWAADRKRIAVGALAGSQPGTAWLLKLKEDGKMPDAVLADAGRLLRNSPFQGVRNKAMILFPPPGKLDVKKLPPIATLAKRQGSVEKGRLLLSASLKNEAQCLKCHTVRGVGGQVGPDLSMIGKKASRENLIESILLPSKAIADQYLQWRIETKKGLDISGLIIEETPTDVLLRDANAKDYRIAKADIESRTKSAVSVMPENIIAALTEDELMDVVEYMLTLKTASLTPDFWNIAGPFANDERDSGLDTVNEPEKTIDLNATYKGKRGDVKWARVPRNADGYVDLMAHFAPNSAQIMSYLFREIESPAEQDATIALSTDDGSKLWVNGEKVYETRAHDAAVPEKARVNVKLKKGKNVLLMKIVNGNNPHGFYFTILSEQELRSR